MYVGKCNFYFQRSFCYIFTDWNFQYWSNIGYHKLDLTRIYHNTSKTPADKGLHVLYSNQKKRVWICQQHVRRCVIWSALIVSLFLIVGTLCVDEGIVKWIYPMIPNWSCTSENTLKQIIKAGPRFC